MTRLVPAAYLAVDGVDVARSTAGGVPTQLLALDGLEVQWGREEALDQQEAAVASLELFDPTRTWHRSRNWVGVPITLRWEVTVAGVTTSRVFFRGRITRVRPALREYGGVYGTVVTLECSSKISDLGNVLPANTWPFQDLGPRRARVDQAAKDAGIAGGVTLRSDWDNAATSYYLVPQKVSLLDRIMLLFESLVERINYSPHTDAITAVGPRDFAGRRTLGVLASDPVGAATDRAGQGVYARARAINAAAGLYLDAAGLEVAAETAASRDQTAAVSRIRFTAFSKVDPPSETAVTEQVVTGVNEAVTGIRTLSVQSGLSTVYQAASLARWQDLVRGDASSWRLEPITMRTDATGGFEDLAQVLELLAGSESNALYFLQGSELPLLGLCPVVGVIGGTLAVVDGGWELEWTLLAPPLVAKQHPITLEELDAGTPDTQIKVWDTPHPTGFHPSLTFEDLAWVGLGHGISETATIPTSEWDFLP